MKEKLEHVGAMLRRRPNTQSGITLIALIITIIILLILAIVSISLIINQGILNKSKKAVDKYSEAEIDEQAKLLQAEYEMAKLEGKFNGTYSEYVVDKKYPGLKIGDYVNYTEAGENYTADTSKGIGRSSTYNSTTERYDLTAGDAYTTENLGWRVLGVNAKGELELISDNPTTNSIYLANEEGYLHGPEELDNMCNTLYGKGEHATGARSLNVDDINTLGNYDPSTYNGYNKKFKYKAERNYYSGGTAAIQYSEDGGQSWKPSYFTTFKIPGKEAINNTNNPGEEELTSTYYSYAVSDKVKQAASDGKSIADIISKGTGTSDVYQWLASRCVSCSSSGAGFYVRHVSSSVSFSTLFYSGYSFSNVYPVRPVVTLKSDIQLSGSSESGWTIN